MLGKVFSGLLLVCVSSSLMAGSPYPIKNLKPATKQEVAAYDAKINEVLANHPNAWNSPLKILQAMPVNSEGGKSYSWCAKKMKNTQICTYRLENVGDDSVAGEVYQFTFKAGEARWTIAKAKKGWRCQPKRGDSTSYHTKNCK